MRFNIGPHDKVTVRRVHYRLHEASAMGYVFERIDQPGIFQAFTEDQFASETLRPDYGYHQGFFSPEAAKAKLFSGVHSFEDIPTSEMPEIFWRERWCNAFFFGEAAGCWSRSDDGMVDAARAIAAEFASADGATTGKRKRAGTMSDEPQRTPPSGFTLRRWILRLEAGGFAASALRKSYHRCGNRTARFAPEVDRLMRRHAVDYASEKRPTKINCWKNLKLAIRDLNEVRVEAGDEPFDCPSEPTFAAAIMALDAFEVLAARKGLEFAKQKFGYNGPGLVVDRAGERIEIDEWLVQLQVLMGAVGLWQVIDEATKEQVRTLRVWLCVAIDAASRCILGMSIARTPSTDNALATLEMCLRPKGEYADHVGALAAWDMCCTPESVVTDAGSTLVTQKFRSKLAALRIRSHVAPAGRPKLRARVERVWGTFHTQVTSRFTGRTFENPVVRGDYNAEERASICVEALCVALVRYTVDIYHQSPHEGLRGETPQNAWKRLVDRDGINPPPGADIRRHVFGIALERTTGPHGVRVLNLNYQCKALQEHRRSVSDGVVRVKVDSMDLGRISVFLGDRWRTAICTTEGLDGISITHWLEAENNIRRIHGASAKVTEHIVFEAIRAIERISTRGIDRIGIKDIRPTAKTIEDAELEIGIGFSLPDPDEPADVNDEETSVFEPPADLFGDAIDGTSSEPVTLPAPEFRITGLDDE